MPVQAISLDAFCTMHAGSKQASHQDRFAKNFYTDICSSHNGQGSSKRHASSSRRQRRSRRTRADADTYWNWGGSAHGSAWHWSEHELAEAAAAMKLDVEELRQVGARGVKWGPDLGLIMVDLGLRRKCPGPT